MDRDDLLARLYFWAGVAALVVIPAVLVWMGLGIVALLIALPVLAWIGSRLLVHQGSSLFSWLSRKPLEKWQGVYYAFNDVQVRVYEDGDELWFVTADVIASVGLKAVPDSYLAIYPGQCKVLEGTRLTVMSPAALENMLGKRNEREPIRFLLWMRREVVKPWERRRGRA